MESHLQREKRTSMWSLPYEIQVDIFIRLPVISILACRCVCKIWWNLLCDPNFIKNHLILTGISSNPRLIFGHSRSNKNPIINSMDYKSISCFSKAKLVSMDYPFENKKIKAIVTLGSCDGLICLGISSGGMGIEEKNCICIWNPLTGEYRNIKVSLSDFLAESEYFVRYGFGYDSNMDDYKLVKISDNEHPGCLKIQVYTLGTKSWRTIQCTDHYTFPGQLHERLPGVLVNGALHWKGGSTTSTTKVIFPKVIISFDINSERLRDFPFPGETLPPSSDWKMYKEVGMLEGFLWVVCSVINSRTDVWVMLDYGVTNSWTTIFSTTRLSMTRYQFFKPIWSFRNGDILVYTRDSNQLNLCEQDNGKTRKVLLHGVNMSRYPESCVESLVSLDTGTYVEKRTTNGNKKKLQQQRLR
ncbi:F-box/kelch-repeat protein At3g06240-like [Papaver somniferum]|uniref:F-box/kelch-repeat protein At3g06240-like n=1 Tax=Papaver somniferum TaxID=3469 RepID=UPI000E6FA239|nr:F-box/kelch-repeat protein At3g06240-like [Papaver somniferum]